MKDIKSYTFLQLNEEMKSIGEKTFRSKQIFEWLHQKLVDSFDEMTNLSKELREKLKAQYEIRTVQLLERQESKLDGTNKFLFKLNDG
ncbi:MAG: 23S rRNA (adenine(2503)-C(2))-methyltransferase RlmN, partial [Lachnospiraceae bacterium]